MARNHKEKLSLIDAVTVIDEISVNNSMVFNDKKEIGFITELYKKIMSADECLSLLEEKVQYERSTIINSFEKKVILKETEIGELIKKIKYNYEEIKEKEIKYRKDVEKIEKENYSLETRLGKNLEHKNKENKLKNKLLVLKLLLPIKLDMDSCKLQGVVHKADDYELPFLFQVENLSDIQIASKLWNLILNQ